MILARFPVAAVGSFLASSGEFMVQQIYVEILLGAFCCAGNFASFWLDSGGDAGVERSLLEFHFCLEVKNGDEK